MEQLNKIIQDIALTQFKKNINTTDKVTEFIFKHSTIEEFFDYYDKAKTYDGWILKDRNGTDMLMTLFSNGIAQKFCHEVLWKKLKAEYMEAVVKSLENRLEATYEVEVKVREVNND